MGKRFKVRISRVIPSLQCCRSKDPKLLPSNPVPSFLRFSPVNPNPITVHISPASKPQHHHSSSFKRHVSSAIISFACGLRSRSRSHYLSGTTDHTGSPPTPEFHWQEEERFHVVAKVFEDNTNTITTTTTPRQKIYNSSASGYTSPDDYDNDDVFPTLPPIVTERHKRHARRKKTTPPPLKARVSSSSVDTELFTSEGLDDNKNSNNIEDEETETLVSSSRSFSTESSTEFNPFTTTSTRKKLNSKVKRAKRGVLRGKKTAPRNSLSFSFSSPEMESPARLSMFLQRLIPCTVDGKVRESFAVVKKSQDPYEDFRRSMMEMILEKQMFEEQELEQLLHCFLTLNSRQHHKVIVEAFSEIWEALFYRRFSSFRVSTSSK